jgi:5-methyltetrahydrofolate--homocysteine methyltransferase
MASILEGIEESIIKGMDEQVVARLTQKAIDEGHEPLEVLNGGLIAGMDTVGRLWKEGKLFIPEALKSAKVMRAGVETIKQKLVKGEEKSLGKVVIGTVKGDVHDIGKSLVSMMMEAFGFEIHDLGVDVSAEKFIETAQTENVDMVCMSALLTTTMPEMEKNIKMMKEAGLGVRTMVGGAPVTDSYAERIGADGYAPDAILAVERARELLAK